MSSHLKKHGISVEDFVKISGELAKSDEGFNQFLDILNGVEDFKEFKAMMEAKFAGLGSKPTVC